MQTPTGAPTLFDDLDADVTPPTRKRKTQRTRKGQTGKAAATPVASAGKKRTGKKRAGKRASDAGPDGDEAPAAEPARARKGKKTAAGGRRATAQDMAARQREISVSEFFTKNRHLLGFDSPLKALLTAVKEAVDNSLDACEEAGIAPEITVEIDPTGEDRYRVAVEDNGPGIVADQVGKVFGKLLYGSKFHKLSQTRGQQGIGISAAGMYGQLTTGKPVRILSRTGPKKQAHEFLLTIDTARNKPDIHDSKVSDWPVQHGTRVEIEMEARYQKGLRSVDMYLKQTAIANPHLTLHYKTPVKVASPTGEGEPVDEWFHYERSTQDLPPETVEIKPHPHGVELGRLIAMLKETRARSVSGFLQEEFTRVGAKVAQEICKTAKVSPKAYASRIAREEANALHQAIQKTKISSPPTNCLSPIGEELVLSGLKKEIEADFYQAVTRPPAVYRGNPFQIEVGIAYGKPGGVGLEVTDEGRIKKRKSVQVTEDLVGAADEPVRVLRFANRVPLLHQQSACAITKAVTQTNWRSYGLQHPKGALPLGPMAILVHIASVWVPFTSESKEALASYPEILKELRLALQECGRKLGTYIRKGKRLQSEFQKRSYIEKYIPHIGIALQEILDLTDKSRDETVETLEDVLQRSRKF